MTDEWGPWIEHDGGECPCVGKMVQCVSLWASGNQTTRCVIAGSLGGKSWDWSNWPKCTKIIRYRIRKPRGLTILENLIADMPEPVFVREVKE